MGSREGNVTAAGRGWVRGLIADFEFGGALAVLEGDGGGVGLAVAVVGDVDMVAGGEASEFFHHLGKAVDFVAGNGEQQVAVLQSGAGCGTIGYDAGYEDSFDDFEVHLFGEVGGHLQHVDAEVAALHLAVASEVAGDFLSQVGGDGEAVARIVAVGRGNGGDDADEAGVGIHQRAARVAWIDGGIGLDERLDGALHTAVVVDDAHVSGFGTDDAGGDCGGEVEGVADGHHGLSDTRAVAIAEGDGGEAGGLDFDDGEVGGRVVAYETGGQDAFVVEGNADAFGILDDVVVGDDIAVGRDDDARAVGAVFFALHALVDDESEEGLVEGCEAGLDGADVDDAVDGAGGHLAEIGDLLGLQR